jgi:sulfate transport system permease protein
MNAQHDPAWVRWSLSIVGGAFLILFLLLPLAAVFAGAFEAGWRVWREAITSADTAAALRLTAIAVTIAVPLNVLFGVTMAFAITRCDFPGRLALITLVDLPFAVSPVISGLVFVLLFGANTLMGSWLDDHGVRVIFAVPGIVLATLFVTVPFVARELIPLMSEQGIDEELAALGLGASFWQTFFRVTVPKIRWGLLYGVVLLTARGVGEFGAVSVVSGHIRGETTTAPLHIEILYNEYNFAAAFAVASILTLVALSTVAATSVLEWMAARRLQEQT